MDFTTVKVELYGCFSSFSYFRQNIVNMYCQPFSKANHNNIYIWMLSSLMLSSHFFSLMSQLYEYECQNWWVTAVIKELICGYEMWIFCITMQKCLKSSQLILIHNMILCLKWIPNKKAYFQTTGKSHNTSKLCKAYY